MTERHSMLGNEEQILRGSSLPGGRSNGRARREASGISLDVRLRPRRISSCRSGFNSYNEKGVLTVRHVNGNNNVSLTLDNPDRRFYSWRYGWRSGLCPGENVRLLNLVNRSPQHAR